MTDPQVRIAAQVWPAGVREYATWRSAIIEADQLGVDYIFGYDHFHKPELEELRDGIPYLKDVQPDVNHFEGWSALASWGEITSTAQIGLLVTGIGYRNPDLLADMARTVDHISGGRLILGLGAGWYEKDYTTYGYDFGTVKSRFDLFDDALVRIENRFEKLLPAPTRKIPILIGGGGERRTLPAVARHADIWHSFESLAEYRRKNELLKELAAGFGRDASRIERGTAWVDAATADEYLAQGVTMYTTEVRPTDDGYDFTEVKEMLAWRDANR